MSEVRKYTEAFISSTRNTMCRALNRCAGPGSGGWCTVPRGSRSHRRQRCQISWWLCSRRERTGLWLPPSIHCSQTPSPARCLQRSRKKTVSQSHRAQSVPLFQHSLKSAVQSALKNNCKSPKLLTLRAFFNAIIVIYCVHLFVAISQSSKYQFHQRYSRNTASTANGQFLICSYSILMRNKCCCSWVIFSFIWTQTRLLLLTLNFHWTRVPFVKLFSRRNPSTTRDILL